MTNKQTIEILNRIRCNIREDSLEEQALVYAISALTEQRWIPCSERLPEEKERSYWVCLETGGQCQCRWTNDVYGLGSNEWSEWGWHIMDKPQYSIIVAWMPLPEPRKRE